MSRAAEWSRLLQHASQRLAETESAAKRVFADSHRQAVDLIDNHFRRRSESWAAMEDYAAHVAAISYARQVMDMLAAFLTDDQEEPEVTT